MYDDFDYYSLIKDGPREDDRWYQIPEGESSQPEELFTGPWIVDPEIVTEKDEFWIKLADLLICLVEDSPDDQKSRFKEWEREIIEYDQQMRRAVLYGARYLFAIAAERRANGHYIAAECAYRLLSLAGYEQARAELGAMVRRGETDSGYTVTDTLRLLVAGVKCNDPVSAMHCVLMVVPPLRVTEGDWSLTEQWVRAFTPTGAYTVKDHWANWDLCGFIEGPLVHFLLILFGKIEPPSETAFADLYRQVRLHFPSIDHLICDRKNCRFWDPAGKEWKVLICGEKWGNEYVIYTDHSRNEDGALCLQAGRSDSVRGWHVMCPLKTEEEQNFIRELLEQLRKEVNEQQTETE